MKILTKKCIVCGKKLIKKKNQNKFCSRKCLYIFQDKRIKKKCSFCGKTGKWKRNFCSHECYAKWLIGKSNNSKTKFKKGLVPWNKGRRWTKEERQKISDGLPKRFGKNAGNWKGGITEIAVHIRTIREYKQWRTAVFERDDYTCQECGARRKKGDRVVIQAHHKKPFYKILAENEIKNIQQAKDCKELWEIDNGQTLCISCHRQTDSYLVNQHTL